MKNSFLHIFCAFMLTISILAPAVLDVLDTENGIDVTQNMGEEESKKEKKNQQEEKEVLMHYIAFSEFFELKSLTIDNFKYFEKYRNLYFDIQLPPPQA